MVAIKKNSKNQPGWGHFQLLIYLANMIEAGFGTSEAPVRPVEALKTVFDILDIGLAHVRKSEKSKPSTGADDPRLIEISPVALFLAGYRIVCRGKKIDSLSALSGAVKSQI